MIPALRRPQWLWLGTLATALVLAQINQPFPEIAPLQHIPTVLLLVAAPWLLRGWPIDNAALGCIVVFLLLHTLGGRYTYSNVPYVEWWHSLTGGDFVALTGWTRNDYDRLVHLSFGLLSVKPALELARLGGMGRRGGLWAALGFVLAVSCLYEIFEWLLTLTLAGNLAADYNGQQGDVWDAQKDMAIAGFGALVGIVWTLVRKRP